MYALMPWLGIVLFVATLRPFVQRRTYVTTVNMIAATCCLIAFVLWPDDNAIALDHVIPVAGLGHVVSRVTMTAAVTLHYIAVCVSSSLWTRRSKLLVIPTLIFMALYIACWVAAHMVPVANPEALYYGGYHGRPDAVLWMSLWRGVTIVWYSAVITHLYVQVGLRARDVWRWTSLVTGGAFAGSVLMGVMAIEEALADRAGHPSSAVLALFSYLLVGCCGTIVVMYLVYTTLRPLWQAVQVIRDYPKMQAAHERFLEEQATLQALRQDVRDLNLSVADKVVLLRQWADAAFVRLVKQCCKDEGLDRHDRAVAVEAATVLSLNPLNIHTLQAPEAMRFESQDDARLSPQRYARLTRTATWHFSDLHLVLYLLTGGEELGVRTQRLPEERHRRIAAVLRRALDDHQQDPALREGYRNLLANREAERRALAELLMPAPRLDQLNIADDATHV